MMYGKTLEQIIQAKDSLTNARERTGNGQITDQIQCRREPAIMQQRHNSSEKNNTCCLVWV